MLFCANLKFICISAAVLLLTGCGPRYSIKPLKPIVHEPKEHIDYRETKNNVTVTVKKFTAEDTFTYFNKEALFYKKEQIQPIQLAITNNSSHVWLLEHGNIDLPLCPASMVARLVQARSTPGIIAMACIGFVASAILVEVCLVLSVITGVFMSKGAFATVALIGAGIGLCGYPYTIYTCYQHKNDVSACNELKKTDIAQKTLAQDSVFIGPEMDYNVLLFVAHKDLQPFTIKLLNAHKNKELTYIVPLK